ncbi:cytochrome P450 [Streptomyces sp. H27-D2]|uniref:cytochrome P450 n=1 Tax=Streptomyces sp. H27-D2 TaxID=3046304 RepID=UPI002DC056BD|nr:cytochrome P450 [Streptomyces sp. H27-D2]MEC4019781.1 cytochrome P450 [Streptomyces sp. H27-D2]
MTVPAPPPGCPAHAGTGRAPVTPLYGADFATDPSGVYNRLRGQGAVAPVELSPGVDAMLVTGYYAALEVLRGTEAYGKDPRRWRALAEGRVPANSPVMPMMGYRPNVLFADGDAHHRLRAAATESLDRVDPHALRRYVEHSADNLIDRFAGTGSADLIAEYARAIPLLVFNDLFGMDQVHGARLMAAMAGIFEGTSPEEAEQANADYTRLISDLIALKRAEPAQDVTSWMMAHPAQLNDEEMIHQVVVMMGAGTEPTSNLISNGLRLLLSDDRFFNDLTGGSLTITDALDEVLWKDPPLANYAVHYPVKDVELAGVPLHAGEPVVVSLAAANTDPSLSATVQRSGNRAHLAYSAGPHACPAQSAARLISEVAIEKLLDRLPDLELDVPADTLQWRPGPFHRALTALPARFTRVVPVTPVAAHPAQLDQSQSHSQSHQTPGDSSWQSSPVPSSSIPSARTSTAKAPGSAKPGRQRWWNSLAVWWRGQ